MDMFLAKNHHFGSMGLY